MAEQVTSLARLIELAKERRAINISISRIVGFRKPMPAAFIVNMQGTMIQRMIDFGMYVYEPKGKK